MRDEGKDSAVPVSWLTSSLITRTSYLIMAALASAAAYALTPPFARLDDAYIALHSARVVLSRQDPVFGVRALVGATSPPYVALLAGLIALGVPNGDMALRIANSGGMVAFGSAVVVPGANGDRVRFRTDTRSTADARGPIHDLPAVAAAMTAGQQPQP